MKKRFTNNHFLIFRQTLLSLAMLFSTFIATAQSNWNFASAELTNQIRDIAYGNGKYVQVGNRGLIRTSVNERVWDMQQSGVGQSYAINSITFANGKFVTVGENGIILSSTDGVSWNKQNSGTQKELKGIAYGNGVFVAVGEEGTIVSSTDGSNWTKCTSGTTKHLNDVAFSAIFFVAVGSDGEIRTSRFDNIGVWTKRASGAVYSLKAVTAGKGTNFVAVGTNGAIMFSYNAFDWTLRQGPANSSGLNWIGVTCNPLTGIYVAINDGYKVATSSDGSNWTAPLINSGSDCTSTRVRFLDGHYLTLGVSPRIRASYNNGKSWSSPMPNFGKMSLKGAAYGNGRFVAVGTEPLGNIYGNFGYANLIINSADGIHFSASETNHLVGGAKCFNDVTFGKSMFVAVGDDAFIQYSADGISWNYGQVTFGKKLTGVAYGNGRFVAVGLNGLILWSVDAKVWYKSNCLGTLSYSGVGFENGQFVLVGEKGVLATSQMGMNWDFKATGTTNELRSVAYRNGKWVAVGTNNTIVTSLNGYGWKSKKLPNSAVSFNDVCYANGQFVAVSASGNVYTSANGDFWMNVTNYGFNFMLNAITHGNGQFFAVGNTSLLMTSPDAPAPVLSDPPKAMDCVGCRTSGEESTVEEGSENEVDFKVVTFPNPVVDEFQVDIQGATGETVRLTLFDLSGRTISDKTLRTGSAALRESISMGQKQPGNYMLRVSTRTQMQTVKIFKQ
ncbi:T9SS type A sorting domain-containing protein [Dyadobacter luticola]|uniref:T9SS type A sorting domain-containing protein n=1 Tax=Dyadobacter luticola TaxID=1979387 RepID=A0A5R9L1U2_9BACT|nr:T9SS type A sorting domain-containing protein [Dyadobacter luticola]TLV02493.1 T9SS type A sorting domain-containing protein [Dyadobacter luticola]